MKNLVAAAVNFKEVEPVYYTLVNGLCILQFILLITGISSLKIKLCLVNFQTYLTQETEHSCDSTRPGSACTPAKTTLSHKTASNLTPTKISTGTKICKSAALCLHQHLHAPGTLCLHCHHILLHTMLIIIQVSS
jgi:hypothetical protein